LLNDVKEKWNYFIIEEIEFFLRGGGDMVNKTILPESQASHAKPVIRKAILCMGRNQT
jgi:hypothetical protein